MCEGPSFALQQKCTACVYCSLHFFKSKGPKKQLSQPKWDAEQHKMGGSFNQYEWTLDTMTIVWGDRYSNSTHVELWGDSYCNVRKSLLWLIIYFTKVPPPTPHDPSLVSHYPSSHRWHSLSTGIKLLSLISLSPRAVLSLSFSNELLSQQLIPVCTLKKGAKRTCRNQLHKKVQCDVRVDVPLEGPTRQLELL